MEEGCLAPENKCPALRKPEEHKPKETLRPTRTWTGYNTALSTLNPASLEAVYMRPIAKPDQKNLVCYISYS